MLKFNDIKMKPKLITLFLMVGLIPLLLLGWWSVKLSGDALKEESFDQLISIREIKKNQIEQYMINSIIEMKMFSRSSDVHTLYDKLVDYHNRTKVKPDGAYDTTTEDYQAIWEEYGDNIKLFREDTGISDIYIACSAHGHVMYTVARKKDIGTNLGHGPYKDSGLAEVWNRVVRTGEYAVADYSPYAPRDNEPASFIGFPIKRDGKLIGVIIFQVSINKINNIMQQRSGMGESGETYLVGADHLMRSDSYLDPENRSVKASFSNPKKGKVETQATKAALKGETGHGIIMDYNGNPVLSAYTPVKIGNFSWALIAEIDEAEVNQPVNRLILSVVIGAAIIAILIIIIAVYIAIQISSPLAKGVTFAETISKGDLTAELHLHRKDEIGILGDALTQMSSNLRSIVGELSENSDSLSSSSEELSAVSSQMASSAEEMSSQSEMIASASEQVSTSVGTVASAAEEASSSVSNIANMTEELSSTFKNVADSSRKTSGKVNEMASGAREMSEGISNVAAAIEQMSASLNEVAKNTSQASNISRDAARQSDEINERMNNLASASKQIGKIVNVIKDIADQTNMLALNATIEAAGAGEAGKGFAVVAGEVKELARQSAEATDEIAGQIEQIQKTTNDAVNGILEIGKIISEIASINENNASAVEEQTSTAGEISRTIAGNSASVEEVAGSADETSKLVDEIAGATNEASKTASEVAKHIDELSAGIREVAGSGAEAAKGVQEISKNIQGINEAAKQTATGANQTNTSSLDLSKMSQKLNELVNRFKL